MSTHSNVSIKDAGLFISQERPYIGASPDAIIMCDCCGEETIEVKCPYCFRERLPEESDKKICLEKDEKGMLFININNSFINNYNCALL